MIAKRELDKKSASKAHNKKAKKPKLTYDTDSMSESGNDSNNEVAIDKIEYNMPKPGPHAKAGEWRKWKMMKRAIKQQREEKRLLKRHEREEEKSKQQHELDESANKVEGHKYSLSIAIPGSIMSKVASKELRTCLAGQIARTATLFCVDEIIIYNEFTNDNKMNKEINEQFVKILEYLECPQYLRKALFPPNKHLEHVGLLVPLEAPHHFRINDEWTYREGVTTDIPCKENKGSYVDIGLMNKIQIDKKLEAGIRVTVKKLSSGDSNKKMRGLVVSPETPRTESGLYWGYQVRYAESFRKILYESCFGEKYDFKIGINLTTKLSLDGLEDKMRDSCKRVLVVFGGVTGGIEAAIEADERFKANTLGEVFDLICENDNSESQFGSRSIRLEEALLISLSSIAPRLKRLWADKKAHANHRQENSFNHENEEDTL